MTTKSARLWREASGPLWVLPALFVAAALVAGALLSLVTPTEGSLLARITFRGGPDDARQLLSVVAATMITVTGLVFVLTVVALQIAATQFSPRLLREFLRDRGTQLTLSIFVATFAYSLAGLYTVGARSESGEAFVPQLAVSGSLALALLSVGMLVYYIQHITNAIRIDSIMLRIERATVASLQATSAPADPQPASPPEGALEVTATRSGYLRSVEPGDLLRSMGGSVWIVPQIGQHVVAGNALALVSPDAHDRIVRAIRRAVRIKPEREIKTDALFGIRQLVDIAIKALAPSMNDPYTAVQAVDHLTVMMCAACQHELGPEVRALADGSRQVVVPRPGFQAYIDLVADEIRLAGCNRPSVAAALLRLLGELEKRCRDRERRSLIERHVHRVAADVERRIDNPEDRQPVLDVASRLVGRLTV